MGKKELKKVAPKGYFKNICLHISRRKIIFHYFEHLQAFPQKTKCEKWQKMYCKKYIRDFKNFKTCSRPAFCSGGNFSLKSTKSQHSSTQGKVYLTIINPMYVSGRRRI